MKKILFSALAISFVVTTLAQKIPGQEQRFFKRLPDRMMLKGPDITDAQKGQFKTEREAFRKQVEDLRKNDDITVKEWKSRMQKLRDDHKSKIKDILTQEQKAKIEKVKTDRKEKHEEMAKKRMEMIKSRLGINSEQSTKWDKAREELKSNMNSIRENKALSKEQKREQYKALMNQHKENMKSILTEDQLKHFKIRPRKRVVI